MPFSGSTYNLPAGYAAANGVVSDAPTQHNAPLEDIEDALTTVKGQADALERRSYATRAAVEAANLSSLATGATIYVRGHTTEGVGGATYIKLASAPSPVKAWHVQSADAAYFELKTDEVTPFMLGAVGDKATNDTTALLAVAAYVNGFVANADPYYLGNTAPKVYFPPCEGFRTTSTIEIEMVADIEMDSAIWVEGAAGTAKVGLRGINTYAATNLTKTARWSNWKSLKVRRLTQSDWTVSNDVGLDIPNAYVCDIDIDIIEGFRISARIGGSYHFIRFAELYGAEVALECGVYNTDEFSNQTKIIGGEISCGGINPGKSRYGIKFVGDVSVGMNSVSYDGVSFELGVLTAQSGNPSGEAVPVIYDGTARVVSEIRGTNLRSEGNGPYLVRTLGTVSNTVTKFLHAEDASSLPDSTLLDDQATISSGNIVMRENGPITAESKEVWRSGRFIDNALGWSTNQVAVRGLEAIVHTGGVPTFREYTTGGWNDFTSTGLMNGYGGAGEALGFRLALNGERSFVLQFSKTLASVANFLFVLWDSAGSQITSANKIFNGFTALSTTTNYNGAYTGGLGVSGKGTNVAVNIGVATGVATVGVYPVESTGIGEINVRSPYGFVRKFAETDKYGNDFFALSSPGAITNLSYKKGTVAKAISPAVGSAPEWVCTVSGSPGTWVAKPNL